MEISQRTCNQADYDCRLQTAESIIEETDGLATARISRNNGVINSSLIGWCLRANASIAGVVDLVGDVGRRGVVV